MGYLEKVGRDFRKFAEIYRPTREEIPGLKNMANLDLSGMDLSGMDLSIPNLDFLGDWEPEDHIPKIWMTKPLINIAEK